MSFMPKPQELYQHFKGNLYQVLTLAKDSESGETLVIYQALYGTYEVYARPLASFTQALDPEKYPQAKQTFRFEPVCVDREGALAGETATAEDGCETTGCEAAGCETAGCETAGCEAATDGCEAKSEEALDPLLLAFLEAETYAERLNALTGLHHRISDEMITTMAICCDLEVPAGSVEERYVSLRQCLLTLERFENTRLR